MNSYRSGDDKWLWLIGAEADRHWEPIARALGAARLIDDERFASSRGRYKNATELVAIFDEIFAQHTRNEWTKILNEHDIWWAPVNSFEDLMANKQVNVVGAFRPMPSTTEEGQEQMSIATPIDFGGSPVEPSLAPPARCALR